MVNALSLISTKALTKTVKDKEYSDAELPASKSTSNDKTWINEYSIYLGKSRRIGLKRLLNS